jgi:imidazolonepropionase-like amidohydrolase
MIRWICAAALALGCVSMARAAQPAAPPLAIEHVTVLSMKEGAAPAPDRTVVIQAGRVVSVSPAAAAKIPAGARRVDGRGKWLTPGFTDMHVHVENDRLEGLINRRPATSGAVDPADIYLPYLARGVTQVLNMSAMSEDVGAREAIEAGRLLGPHLMLAAMIDGDPPIWPVGMTRVATTPEAGRQTVRDVKAGGFDFIKIYSNMDLATFRAVVDEARKQHMKVLGHIPGRGQGAIEHWLVGGLNMVAHAEEFAYQTPTVAEAEARIAAYVALAKANGVGLEATLTTDMRIAEQMRDPTTLKRRPELAYVHPSTRAYWENASPYANAGPERIAKVEAVVAFNARLVKAFADAGLPVFAGTDTSVPGIAAGASLHDEFEALVGAGLSPRTVLESATRGASQWLGVGADRGTIELGKRADLVLLDKDPLADVANTRAIAAVIVGGRFLPRAELDRRMAALKAKYAAMSAKATGRGSVPTDSRAVVGSGEGGR